MFLIHSLVRSSSFLHCQMCLRPLLNYLGDFYRTETDFSQPKMKTKNSLLTFLYLGYSWSSDFYRSTFHTIIPTFLENAFSFWTVSSELLLGIVYRGRSERMKRTLSSGVALNFNRQRRTRKRQNHNNSAMCNFNLVPFLQPSICLIIRWARKRGLFLQISPLVSRRHLKACAEGFAENGSHFDCSALTRWTLLMSSKCNSTYEWQFWLGKFLLATF